MKRIWTAFLVIALSLGQAPAWALTCGPRCLPASKLACLHACATSAALLTRHGKLPSLGNFCGRVEARFAQPSLAAISLPATVPPQAAYTAPRVDGTQQARAIIAQIHAQAPPCPRPAQALLSVPLCQAPPLRA
jgi:hypothetical protein